MKFVLSILVTSALLLALLLVVDANAFTLFLLAGVVPGTNISLAPSTMLAIMTASALMIPIISRRKGIFQFSGRVLTWLEEKYGKPQKPSLPKRRFNRI